jgi:hypothetical protein
MQAVRQLSGTPSVTHGIAAVGVWELVVIWHQACAFDGPSAAVRVSSVARATP